MSQILTAQNLILRDICNQILEIDNSIRFAGFANNMGTILAARHREALMSVENKKEYVKFISCMMVYFVLAAVCG